MSHFKLLIIHIQTPWFSSDKNTHEQASNQTDSSRTSNEPITRNTNQVFTYSSLKKKKSVWKQMEWQRRRLCDVTATQAALCCSVTCCYVTYLSFHLLCLLRCCQPTWLTGTEPQHTHFYCYPEGSGVELLHTTRQGRVHSPSLTIYSTFLNPKQD